MSEPTKEIVKHDPDLIAALRAQTGEKNTSFPKIPSIVIDHNQFLDAEETKVNPHFGHFAFEHIEGEGDTFKKELEHIGPTLTCVILRNRYMGKYFDSNLSTTTAFTREFDDFKDEIKVFNKDKEVISMGIWKEVKDHSQYTLSSRLILYVWFQDQVYRLNVGSGRPYDEVKKTQGSLSALWAYQARLRAAESSMAAVQTEISTQKDKAGTNTFFNLTFNEAGLFDIPTALKLTKDLNDALNIYEMARDISQSGEPELVPPADPEFQESMERISVEDLPF